MYFRNLLEKDKKTLDIPVDVTNYKSLEMYLEDQAKEGWFYFAFLITFIVILFSIPLCSNLSILPN